MIYLFIILKLSVLIIIQPTNQLRTYLHLHHVFLSFTIWSLFNFVRPLHNTNGSFSSSAGRRGVLNISDELLGMSLNIVVTACGVWK